MKNCDFMGIPSVEAKLRSGVLAVVTAKILIYKLVCLREFLTVQNTADFIYRCAPLS